jgi:hypothetical protein
MKQVGPGLFWLADDGLQQGRNQQHEGLHMSALHPLFEDLTRAFRPDFRPLSGDPVAADLAAKLAKDEEEDRTERAYSAFMAHIKEGDIDLAEILDQDEMAEVIFALLFKGQKVNGEYQNPEPILNKHIQAAFNREWEKQKEEAARNRY